MKALVLSVLLALSFSANAYDDEAEFDFRQEVHDGMYLVVDTCLDTAIPGHLIRDVSEQTDDSLIAAMAYDVAVCIEREMPMIKVRLGEVMNE